MYALSECLSNAYQNIGYHAIPDHKKAHADMYFYFKFNAQVNVSTVHFY